MKRKQKLRRPKRLNQTIRRHLKLVFIPHKANEFRPHAVRRYGLVAALVLVITTQAACSASATDTVSGTQTSITSQALLKGTNVERSSRDLSPLKLNDELSRAAALKAQDMFDRQYWAHVAPDGTTPWYWLEKVGYSYKVAGENLARGFSTPNGAVAAWMSSPDHRKNILDANYADVGFAAVRGTLNGQLTTLIVALYGQPGTNSMGLGTVATPKSQMLSPMTRLGVALQAMTPMMMASLFVLAILTSVALTAHMYRRKLPRHLRESWYRHHGLLKAGGMISLVAVMIFLYSGGQI